MKIANYQEYHTYCRSYNYQDHHTGRLSFAIVNYQDHHTRGVKIANYQEHDTYCGPANYQDHLLWIVILRQLPRPHQPCLNMSFFKLPKCASIRVQCHLQLAEKSLSNHSSYKSIKWIGWVGRFDTLGKLVSAHRAQRPPTLTI